jgi:prolyl oligopeptidase
MARLVPLFALGCALTLAGRPPARAAEAPPPTPKKPVTDTYHGVRVTDDYRWLEDAADPAVRRWTEAQNRCTRSVLDRSPALRPLRRRLRELMTAPSPGYSGLRVCGGTLFALKSQPPKEQPFLVTLKSADDPGSARVLLDPNALDAKGKTAIDFYVPARDGRLVAVSLSEGGSEEGTVHVYEAATGKKLPDVIPRVQYPTAGGDVAWDADGTGFYYTRYPRAGERPGPDLNFYQQVYFHKLGTATAQDTYVLGKDFPRIAETSLDTSGDGRYLLATVQNGDGGEFEHHLRDPGGRWTRLTRFADRVSAAAFGPPGDDALYLLSRRDAPRGRILRLPLDHPSLARAATAVQEGALAIDGLRFGTNRLYTTFVPAASGLYVVDADGGPSRLRFVRRDGGEERVPLPTVSSVKEVLSLHGDEVLIHVETYLQPPAWYSFKRGDSKLTRTALYRTSPADFSDCEVVREFAVSKDGTRVPLNILRPRGIKLDGNNPTLLTGYGGFGISLAPRFRVSNRVWLEQGACWPSPTCAAAASTGRPGTRPAA